MRLLPERPAARGAARRARIFALLRFSLLFWACVYFALIAISGHTFIRSYAFGLAAAFALWLILGALFSDNEPIPIPDPLLFAALVAWCAWSAVSLAWSIHPAYSRSEFGPEIGWGVVTASIFYVAARTGQSFRALIATAVGAAGVLAILAIYAVMLGSGTDAEHALAGSHGGVGAFSTFLVLILPFLPLLLVPKPAGFGAGKWPVAVVAILFALILIAARLTENRMIWVAFGVGFLVAALVAAWRWHGRIAHVQTRWAAMLLALFVVFGALFVDAARERARTDFPPETSVAQTIADDPRIVLWQHTFERIRERPWIGFGFGKSILRTELRGETENPLLAHGHNLFLSQWLQTGALGVLTLVALLAALCWRYAAFVRADDATLAAIGVTGLVMLAAFVVKNLTDDFMIRPTSKEFWALNAMLIGYGLRRARMAG